MFVTAQLEQPSGFWGYLASVAHGRSASAFALISGVSLGLIVASVTRQLTAPRHRYLTSPATHPTTLDAATLDAADLDAETRAMIRFQVRRTVAIRALFLIVLAGLLALPNERILLILDNYGLWFFLSMPFLFARVRVLLGVVAGLIFAGIPLFALLDYSEVVPESLWQLLGGDDYSLPAYLAYVLVGLALYRLGWLRGDGWLRGERATSTRDYPNPDTVPREEEISRELDPARITRKLAIWGAVVAVIGYGLGTLMDSLRLGRLSGALLGRESFYTIYTSGPSVADLLELYPDGAGEEVNALVLRAPERWQFWYECLGFVAPHTDSVLETVANLGWGVALVSLLLLVSGWIRRVLAGGAAGVAVGAGSTRRSMRLLRYRLAKALQYAGTPVAALGSMPLSAYCLHVLWHAVTWHLGGGAALMVSYLVSLPVLLSAAWLWRWASRRGGRSGRGPVESLLRLLSAPR